MSVMAGMVVTLGANALDFTSGGINYSTLDESTVQISKTTGASGTVTIPSTVTNAGVTYTVTKVGDNAFTRCGSLSEIKLPETVTVIGSGAFTYCFGLKNMAFPSKLETIKSAAFYQCNSFTKLNFPASVKTIEDRILSCCYNMQEVTVDPANPNFCSIGGVLYSKDKTVLMYAPAKISAINFPAELKEIAVEGICGASNITELNLPDGLKKLKSHAIQGTSVTKLVIPESVTFMDEYSLAENSKMSFCQLPSGINKIPSYCFWGCNALNEVVIPANVTTIASKAFYQVNKLPRLMMKPVTPPNAISDAFETTLYSTTKVLVPQGSLSAYQNHSFWKQFTTYEEYTQQEEKELSVAVLESQSPAKVPVADAINLTFSIKNEGTAKVNSVTAVLTVDGVAQTADNFNIAIESGAIDYITISKAIAVGQHNCSLAITKVNGQNNDNAKASKDFTLEVIDLTIPDDAPMAAMADFQSYDGIGNVEGKAHLEAAARFDLAKLAGCKVIGASLGHLPSKGLSETLLWISETLPGDATTCKNIVAVSQKGDEVKGAFTDPFVITTKPFYVGIATEAEGTNYPIPYCGPKDTYPESLLFNSGHSRWANYEGTGVLPIILYLQGDIKADALSVEKIKCLPVQVKGKELIVPVEVINYGTTEINNVEYTLTTNGNSSTSRATLATGKYIGQKSELTITTPAYAQAGNYDVTLAVDKVNGSANTVSGNKLNFVFSVGEFLPTHRPVLEEMTGTTCGFCPRGTIALNTMKEKHADFIGAAYHKYNSDDPMYFQPELPFRSAGAPSGMMDRDGVSIDPYYGTNYGANYMAVEDYFAKSRDIVSPADITIESSWNADHTAIDVKAKAEFAYVEPQAGYKLGYILTLDGIDHQGMAAWKQSNYYFGNTDPKNDEIISQIYHPETFNEYAYNHVVYQAAMASGVDGSIPSTVKIGDICEDNRSLSVTQISWSDPDMIEDENLENTNVIVLLIDKNGRIRNAQEARVGEAAGPTSVRSIVDDNTNAPVVYYDMMGRRVAQPQGGIYIKVQGNKATKIAL